MVNSIKCGLQISGVETITCDTDIVISIVSHSVAVQESCTATMDR